jgi:hypothetical protein
MTTTPEQGFNAGVEAAKAKNDELTETEWRIIRAAKADEALSDSGRKAVIDNSFAKIAAFARSNQAIHALKLPETVPASCPACHDETDCSNVRTCNAIEEAYAAETAPAGDAEKLADKLARDIAYDLRMGPVHCFNLTPTERDLIIASLRAAPQWQSLTCDEQFALAKQIAANIGYVLTPEPDHPDSPHCRATSVQGGE